MYLGSTSYRSGETNHEYREWLVNGSHKWYGAGYVKQKTNIQSWKKWIADINNPWLNG